jgi:NTE family protein
MKKHKHKWALVLSGGGARGLAHVGLLKGLEEAGFPKPSLVAGTSMGAIVGGFYACGMSPVEMERFVIEEFKISDYIENFAFRLQGPVGQIVQTGQVLASLATSTGIDKGRRALELLRKLSRGKTFEETEIPFRCNAVDLLTGKEVVFSSGPVARAIRASISFPVFFEPFRDKGMFLVDGGLFNNMPVDIAQKEGYVHILAVNVNRFSQMKAGELMNGPQIIYRSIESVLNFMQNENRERAKLTINVTDDATPFSFYRKKEFISLGEQAVRKNRAALEDFFGTGE